MSSGLPLIEEGDDVLARYSGWDLPVGGRRRPRHLLPYTGGVKGICRLR